MKRRQLLKSAAAASTLAPTLSVANAPTTLTKTPADFEGPFYPVGERKPSNDLILGAPRTAVLTLGGIVSNVDGTAMPGAIVDLWQTDGLGRYDHPRDPNPGDRWRDFAYWGEAVTDNEGAFEFRTYVPGAYGGRPSHIHYKIWHQRKRLLTSQIYFAERGGTRGASRHPEHAALQTVELVETADAGVQCFVRVVV